MRWAMATPLLLAVAALVAYAASEAPTSAVPADLEAIAQLAGDLAAVRVGVDRAAVRVRVAEHVTWPNGALGCPRPGINYTQALVAGYRIEVEVGGAIHHYHGRSGGEPFFCAHPGPRSGWIQDF